ncbi:MAG: Fe-S cluster assembly protein SufB [Candidatus Nanoarchaeia archaeon]
MSDLTVNEDYMEKYGFHDKEKAVVRTGKGLTEDIIKQISKEKNEPEWMLNIRLKAFKIFLNKELPTWGGDLSKIDFDNITYYLKPSEKNAHTWEDVPEEIKRTFDRLGIPEAEQKFLGGVGAQYESESVYHSLKEDLAKQGVIFTDMDTALKEHPDIVKKYFGTIIPSGDNKFAALNTAVWSGGSFVYIPKGVKVELPLQAYFRINAKNMGQFERTIIVAEEGAEVHYIEGCFTKGTPILTADGIKPIESVEINDFVLTHNLDYKKVYNIQKRNYTGDLYKLKYFTDSRQQVEVTGEHPILAVRRDNPNKCKNTSWSPEWIPAKILNKEDYVVIPIDRTTISRNERFVTVKFGKGRHGFEDVDVRLTTDKDFFRLIGYYLSEGSISGESYLNFTFHKNERAFIDDVKELLERFFGKEPIEQKEYKNGISIVLCSTVAARVFKKLFGKGAKNQCLPNWVLLESSDKQAELIKGMWRGDGNVFIERYSWGLKRMFRINTISETLADQLRKVLLRLGVVASINVWQRKPPRSNSFVVYVGGDQIPAFAEVVGEPPEVFLDVIEIDAGDLKQIKLTSYCHIEGDYAFVPIRSIEKEAVADLDVYNFSVEEDESYVSNGILVHNCTAPVYSSDSLHGAVVEVFAHKNAKIRYTTIQNWSGDVYNLVTKRAVAYENATVEWIDGNLGSKLTMKYPAVLLKGRGAKADILSVAYSGKGQHQDAGAKVMHLAPDTTSRIVSKSVCKDGGRGTYRGLVRVAKGATNSTASVQCDALLLDEKSRSDTYPTNRVEEQDATLSHEAYVGKVGEEQLFYLMSRGLNESEALAMIVLGFIAEFTKELPMEYSIELNKLIRLEMEDGI